MAMVRKQVYIEARQEALLKRLSERLDVSEAQLIREAIDASIGHNVHGSSDSQRSAWNQFLRLRDAWLDGASSTAAQWTRDDLYEERLGRYGRSSSD